MKDAQDALDRMKRAYSRGTGCHLAAEMIDGLNCTIIGQMWDQDRPATDQVKDDGKGGGA